MRPLACLLAVAALLLAAAPAEAAQRRVPQGWLGVVADGPLTATDPALQAGEWDLMATAGTESVRTAFRWNLMQPYASARQVPAAEAARFRLVRGVPTDFGTTDALVAAAARRGMAVLPVLQDTPGWAASSPGGPTSPPRSPATFGRYLAALVARYGPRGSLWAERRDLPRVPIRAWQVWNEPNITRYWARQPFARSYVRLLRAADRALDAADPRATLVLAGLPNFSWRALRAIYRAGGRGHFDAVALHPYTGDARDTMRIVGYVRQVMRRFRDGRLPLWVTELSFPAAEGRIPREIGFETTDAGQAARLGDALRRMASARRRHRIQRVFWYTWLSSEAGPSAFDWSGLRRERGGARIDAPALAVFRAWAVRLQGCAKAAGDARRCA